MANRARKVLRARSVRPARMAHPAIRAPQGLLALRDPRVSDPLVLRDLRVLTACPACPGLLALRVLPARLALRAQLVPSARPDPLVSGRLARLAQRERASMAQPDPLVQPAPSERRARRVRPARSAPRARLVTMVLTARRAPPAPTVRRVPLVRRAATASTARPVQPVRRVRLVRPARPVR